MFKFIDFTTVRDNRGQLVAIEGEQDVPFPIRRVFFVRDTPYSSRRGNHAHIKCQQLILVPSGTVRVMLEGEEFLMSTPRQGLYVPAGVKVTLDKFTTNAIVMVLCSEHYDPADYIYD